MVKVMTDDPQLFMKWFELCIVRFGCVTKYDLIGIGYFEDNIRKTRYELRADDRKFGWKAMDCIKGIEPCGLITGGKFGFEIQLTEPEEL